MTTIIDIIKAEDLIIAESDLEGYLLSKFEIEVPYSATCLLLDFPDGESILKEFYRLHLSIAKEYQAGIILDSIGWRANNAWATHLGVTKEKLQHLNDQGIKILMTLREEYKSSPSPIILSGVIGPRTCSTSIEDKMTYDESTVYHGPQIQQYAAQKADIVTAYSISYIEEALGIIKAAKLCNIPVAISFRVDETGHLPSGQMLRAAITEADLVTNNYTSYFMIDCTHFHSFIHLLEEDEELLWVGRVWGICADALTDKASDPDNQQAAMEQAEAFARHCRDIYMRFPHIKIFGGCCGTSSQYIQQILKTCKSSAM